MRLLLSVIIPALILTVYIVLRVWLTPWPIQNPIPDNESEREDEL